MLEMAIFFKRLHLVKTIGWQHRFFDLTILSPIWLGTYEYMKNTLYFFLVWNSASREDFSDLVKNSQIWPIFCVHEKSLFWAFWGTEKVPRPLVITKVGAWSEKTPKNWIGRSGWPKMRRMNFWPVLRRNLKIFWFYWPNHRRQIFVVQIPNLSVFGLFEVFLNNKRAFGLVEQP